MEEEDLRTCPKWLEPDPDDERLRIERYRRMTPEDRDREIQVVCRTAMNQWLALPAEKRLRWPPEPGAEGDRVLRRWMEELRAEQNAHPRR